MVVTTGKFDSKFYIYIYIYIYTKKKNLTKKLGSFYIDSFNFVSLVPTRSIVIMKYDVVAIICDGSVIQCDVGTLQFYIY